MSEIPVEIFSSDEGRQIDRRATGLGEFEDGKLMRAAGRAAFQLIQELWPAARSIAICCGPGNNGGDGFVVAEAAALSGFRVDIWSFGAPQGPEACQAFRRTRELGLPFIDVNSESIFEVDLIVDGILGTGMKREPDGSILEGIRKINRAQKPVLALDIPTGLNADSGAVANEAVCATATISFVSLSPGIFMGNGPYRCGRLFFADLDLPEALFAGIQPVCRRITVDDIVKRCSDLPIPSHKGEAGHLLVIGGASGMSGAVRLTAEAALRAGAGSVTVATEKDHAPFVNIGRPELMVYGVSRGRELLPLFEAATDIVVGPGLGRSEWSQDLMAVVLDSGLPLVVDADGLALLAKEGICKEGWILTPHPGEAGTLLHGSTREVQDDRVGAVKRIQEAYGGVCVLKGAGTLVGAGGPDLLLCDRGNYGMASAGMGDLLSGIIGALLAQGADLYSAAVCGTWIHSTAADLASAGGKRGMVAKDLLPFVRQLLDDPAFGNS